MKKLFTLFLVAVMSLNMFSVMAQDGINDIETQRVVSDDEYKLLKVLNLVNDEEYAQGDYLTRAEFCKILCKLFDLKIDTNAEIPFRDIDKTHLYYPEVATAYTNGLVKGVSTYAFAPNRIISAEEAVIMLISGLGLGKIAETKNITYTSYAQQINLTKGITIKLSDSLDEQNAYKLMYNTLFSYPLQWEDGSYEIEFAVSDEYLIKKLYDITKVYGIITETSQSSLYGAGTIKDGFIRLNGKIYTCKDEGLNDLLGYAVQAYVVENDKNDCDEIICASIDTRKSKEITALSKDIEEIGENYAKILEKNRTKTIKIRDSFDMIYNGIGVKNHDNVKPVYGEVKFVDNTGDGVYDIVFVKDYKVISVKSFSNDGKLLQIVGDDESVFTANISEPEYIVKVYLNDELQSTSKTDVITSGSVIWVVDSGVGDIRLIEIRKLQLVLNLFKFCIRQRLSIQTRFIILLQDISKIFPKIFLCL